MAIEFGEDGLTVVATGSLGVCFFITAPDVVPENIAVEAMPEGGDVGDQVGFGNLQILTGDESEWKYVQLTGPLKFGVTYDVTVKFDGVSVYTETLTIPIHGGRKGAVLRQRIYEVLLEGYREGHLEALPYGDGHSPGAINDNDFKPEAGTAIEVGNYYPSAISMRDYSTRQSQLTVPLNVHAAMDDETDVADTTIALEGAIDYLLKTDWRLNGFGMFQSAATFEGNEPEINNDRTVAVLRASLNMPMRNRIVR